MVKNKKGRQMIDDTPFSRYRPIAEEPFGYIIPCPECERRAYDISDLPEHFIILKLKCPHCNKIVETPIFAGLTEGLSVFICK